MKVRPSGFVSNTAHRATAAERSNRNVTPHNASIKTPSDKASTPCNQLVHNVHQIKLIEVYKTKNQQKKQKTKLPRHLDEYV